MATLKQAIDFAKANPNSEQAKQLYQFIVTGQADSKAQDEGIDLSKFGRPSATGTSVIEPMQPGEDKPSYIERIRTRLGERTQQFKQTREEEVAAGTRTVGREITRPIGGVAGGLSDIIFETIRPVVEPVVGGIVKSVAGGGGLIGDFIKSPAGQELKTQFSAAKELIERRKESDPEFAAQIKDLEDAGNLGMFILDAIGVGEAITGTKAVARTGLEVGKDIIGGVFKETGNLATDVKNLVAKTKGAFVDTVSDKAKLRATFTNLDKQIYRRVENPEYAQKVKTSMEVMETGSNPYFNLVQDAGKRISALWENTKKTFGETAKRYVASGETYDVGARLKEIVDSVDSFKTGKNIDFDVSRNAKGQITGYKLTKGRYSPYTQDEINNLNRLIDDIMSARGVNADELLALDQKFGSYYNAVNPNTPTAYHAAVMELKNSTQARIRELLSGDMKKAYEQYARVSNLKDDFGNKIVDSQGNLKQSAEQYLSNLTNKNKGVQQLDVSEYSDLLGIDLVNEAQAIADARKFMLTQAPNGGRLSDFLKSNIFTGAGAAVGSIGGPLGAGAGAAVGAGFGAKVTSPRFIGGRAIEESIKKGAARSTPQILETPKFPKASGAAGTPKAASKGKTNLVKEISKMDEFDVVDSLRSLNSQDFTRSGKLNLDAFTEVQDLISKANKAGAKFTIGEINRGREILRLLEKG